MMPQHEPLEAEPHTGSRITVARDGLVIDTTDHSLDARELAEVVMSLWIGVQSVTVLKSRQAGEEDAGEGEDSINEGYF